MLFNAHMCSSALSHIRGSFNLTTFKKITTKNSGLLIGASDKFFTTNLDLTSAAKLVNDSDSIFRGAIAQDLKISGKDAGLYLNKVKKNAADYLKNGDICGRHTICTNIRDAILEVGSLTFITGGRSVGKTKILESIVKDIDETQEKGKVTEPPQNRVSVIMVDGRKNSDLVAALSRIATRQAAVMKMKNITKVMPSVTISTPVGMSASFDFTGIDFMQTNVSDMVDELAFKHTQDTNHTVLILDEANVFLNCSGKDAAVKYTQDLFNAVVANTKQKRLMSVVLVSSDEGLPFHLEDLGLNPNHISSTFVINEPTPRECRDLLQNKLGVGEHLSSALLNSYGGNVYQMCMLLERIPSLYKQAECKINIFMGPAEDISRALGSWKADKGEETEMLDMLKELARTGFVPMSSDNKIARLLTKFNVCAFLTDDAVEYQIPEELRKQRAGLIPASQLLRVLIARKLAQIEEDKKRKAKK